MVKERHPDQNFHLADICEWNLPRQYNFISAWDSIWHATLGKHESILKNLCEGLDQPG